MKMCLQTYFNGPETQEFLAETDFMLDVANMFAFYKI